MLSLLFTMLLAAPPQIRAVAVAPHFDGARTPASTAQKIDEIAALGATHVQLVVQWGQADIYGHTIAPYRWGTDDAEIRRLIAYAHQRGLKVFLFPVLRLATLRPGEWRGTLEPQDRAQWWAGYRRFILHYAQLAAETQVELYSVGSELGAMEHERLRWLALILAVRGHFSGALTYSANWDHYTKVRFWPALDLIGVNGYHPLSERDDASEAELGARWITLRDQLLRWRPKNRPLLLTEVGYPSVDGAARRPWHYTSAAAVDLEEQRRAWAAVYAAWHDQPDLIGLCVWAWHGTGGPSDGDYTVRHKPAAAIIRRWFKGVPNPR